MERIGFTAGTSTVPASAVVVRPEMMHSRGTFCFRTSARRTSGYSVGCQTCLYPDMQADVIATVTCHDIRRMTRYSVSWDNAVTGLPMVRHIHACCQMQDCGSHNPVDITGTALRHVHFVLDVLPVVAAEILLVSSCRCRYLAITVMLPAQTYDKYRYCCYAVIEVHTRKYRYCCYCYYQMTVH